MKKPLLIFLIVALIFLVSCIGPRPPDIFDDFPPRPTRPPVYTPEPCVGEGGSLGAVVPGNYKQCCPGLVQQDPGKDIYGNQIIGSRGTCVRPTPQLICSDSDGPKNFDVKGKTFGTFQTGKGLETKWWEDYCVNNMSVYDFTCKRNINPNADVLAVWADSYTCPDGCKDGACVKTPTPTLKCTDSDGGKNYDVKGVGKGIYAGKSGGPSIIYGQEPNPSYPKQSQDSYDTYIDYCYNGKTLNEAYCENNKLQATGYLCQYGCKDGACLSKPIPPQPTVSEIEFSTPGNLLELDETLGAVRQTLTEFDTPILKGSKIATGDKGGQYKSTKVNQYLQFPSQKDYKSNRVIFGKDNIFGNVGKFFFAKNGAELATLTLEFEGGLPISSGTQLRGQKVNILGKDFTIFNADFSKTSPYGFLLDLMSGLVVDKLYEGDKRTYLVNGKEYTVEVLLVSKTNNLEVLLKVNGQVLPKMRTGNTEPTNDGLLVGVVSVSNTDESTVAEIALGATHLELEDIWNDNEFTEGQVIVNNEGTGNDVKMNLTRINPNTWVLSNVKIKINVKGIVGDVFVPPGHTLKEYLENPQALMTRDWDIKYKGWTNEGTTQLIISPSARDEYKLGFINQEGLSYNVPLASTRQSRGVLQLGEYSGGMQRNLVNKEGTSIKRFDYFVLSASRESGLANTHVLKYEGYDSNRKVIAITDLATGTREVSALNGYLNVGGYDYPLQLDLSKEHSDLLIDLNSNGKINAGERSTITTESKLILDIGKVENNVHLPVTFITLKKYFDDGNDGLDLIEKVYISALTDGTATIGSYQGITTHQLKTEPEIWQGGDKYGTTWEFFEPKPSGSIEVHLNHPLKQITEKVSLVSGFQPPKIRPTPQPYAPPRVISVPMLK